MTLPFARSQGAVVRRIRWSRAAAEGTLVIVTVVGTPILLMTLMSGDGTARSSPRPSPEPHEKVRPAEASPRQSSLSQFLIRSKTRPGAGRGRYQRRLRDQD